MRRIKCLGWILCIALWALSSGNAHAYVTTLDENNGSLSNSPFAEVKIVELTGPDSGKFQFTVTLLAPDYNGLNIESFGFNPDGVSLMGGNISGDTGWELNASAQFNGFGTFLYSWQLNPSSGTGQQPLIFIIDVAGDSIETYASLLSTGNDSQLFAVKTSASGAAGPFIAGGTVVPIPAALPLFLSALAALGLVARRRQKATALAA